jgi:hypothetical protein
MMDCRLKIIRAVNYCDMKREELLKEAIEKRVTIGEIYVERLKQIEDEKRRNESH